jgi:hypothetical protein
MTEREIERAESLFDEATIALYDIADMIPKGEALPDSLLSHLFRVLVPLAVLVVIGGIDMGQLTAETPQPKTE